MCRSMLRNGDSIIRDTSESSWLLTILIVTASLAVWLWSLVNLPSIKDIAIVYLFMSIDAMILGGFAYISNNIFPFAVLGVPKLKEAVLPVLVGVSYGLIFIFVGGGVTALASSVPLFSVATPFLALTPALLFLTYGIFAPLSEDLLFQSTMLPMMARIFNKPLAIMMTALGFSAMHWFFFGGSIALLITVFIFYIIAGALTTIFRTAVVSMSAHITYNMLIIMLYLGMI